MKNILPPRFNPFHWRKAAYHDSHGLLNRTWLFDSAERLYRQKKNTWDFILLYIDLRNFKEVNDRYSHTAGNEVLISFYGLLEKQFRTSTPTESPKVQRDTSEKDILIVREGGDEFVVFLPIGVCDEEKRDKAIRVIRRRVKKLSLVYEGIDISARIAMVLSTPDKLFKDFASYFLAADKKLTNLHKKEKIFNSKVEGEPL